MQFGFQGRINKLQAAIEVASWLETEDNLLAAFLALKKAYDTVSRRLIIRKLESLGVPANLVSQVVVFLLQLLVRTSGDVTGAIAILTIGLAQGGTESPALFRI